MGKLEKGVQRRAKRERIQQKILPILFRLTTRSASLTFAPESLLLKKLDLDYENKWKPTYKIRQAIRKLNRKGLVEYQRSRNRWTVRLTQKGEKLSEKLEVVERIKIKKPARWDGRWRIVIFDIWERQRAKRDKLRIILEKAGFWRIQNSVWVYPYDCEELVAFLRTDMHLGNGILYVIADGIENDYGIRKHFKLS